MGSWNGTCAVTQLHVTAGQDVAVFMLLKNKSGNNSFCYSNALYDLCPLPFYGKYNDYGAVENCHGFGLPIILSELNRQLYEFGQGPNQYHDCEVRRGELTEDLLFEADHEGRLGIEERQRFNSDEYDLREFRAKKEEGKVLTDSEQFEMDRLAGKLKGEDRFRQVTHVIIHGDVFRAIMNDWYIEEYVGDKQGDKGYNNNYRHVYFSDLKASIPEYIRRMKEASEKSADAAAGFKNYNSLTRDQQQALYRLISGDIFEWNDECAAGSWMQYFKRDSSSTWDLINVEEYVRKYSNSGDWENLEKFVTEALTAAWVNSFMTHARKLWTKQGGSGSQNAEHGAYQVLVSAYQQVLKTEKGERNQWDQEEEE